MKKVNDILKERLESKKNDLKRRQKNFIAMCVNDIECDSFERNATNELTVTQQLKAEIKELEHCIFLYESQLKNSDN